MENEKNNSKKMFSTTILFSLKREIESEKTKKDAELKFLENKSNKNKDKAFFLKEREKIETQIERIAKFIDYLKNKISYRENFETNIHFEKKIEKILQR